MKFIDEDGFSEDTSFNIDVEFWTVTFVNIPSVLSSLKIIEILGDELPEDISRQFCNYNQKIFELQDKNGKYYIIAAGVLIGVNRWENEDRIFNYNLNLEHDEIVAKS